MNNPIPQAKVKPLPNRASLGWSIHTQSEDTRHLFEKVTLLQSIGKPDLEQMDMRMSPKADSMKRQVLKDFLVKSIESFLSTRPASSYSRGLIINSRTTTFDVKDFVTGHSSA
jgi:hypothetical protein